MTMLAWSDDYSVEIEEIDEQHKQLVALINKLYDALARKQQRDEISTVLDELVDYTKVHFAVEECLMRIFHYPEYDAHKAIHDDIVGKVITFQSQYHAGNDKVGMELLMFLKDWLMDHINKVDKAYVPHLTKHGVKRKWLKKFW